MITEADLLELQEHAMATDDAKLLYNTWHALGRCPRVAFEPVTPRERREAQQFCKDRLEHMKQTGQQLLKLPTSDSQVA